MHILSRRESSATFTTNKQTFTNSIATCHLLTTATLIAPRVPAISTSSRPNSRNSLQNSEIVTSRNPSENRRNMSDGCAGASTASLFLWCILVSSPPVADHNDTRSSQVILISRQCSAMFRAVNSFMAAGDPSTNVYPGLETVIRPSGVMRPEEDLVDHR
jgi:hypothetical protein